MGRNTWNSVRVGCRVCLGASLCPGRTACFQLCLFQNTFLCQDCNRVITERLIQWASVQRESSERCITDQQGSHHLTMKDRAILFHKATLFTGLYKGRTWQVFRVTWKKERTKNKMKRNQEKNTERRKCRTRTRQRGQRRIWERRTKNIKIMEWENK